MPGINAGEVLARLGFDVDDQGADRFERRLDKVRREAHKGATAKLDVDSRHGVDGMDRYERRVRDVDRAHGDLVRGTGRVRGAFGSLFVGGAGVAAGAVAFGGLAAGVKGAYDAFEESNKISKQTDAVLKSTGGQAGVTAKQVSALATAISNKTGVDDEAIQSGENLLLTFTNVRNETGRGNDIFNRATRTITDMSAALGQDTKSSAIQLGKALNDPIKGVTALQRVGVSFTAKQKDQIKGLVEHGKTLDAQKMILRELNKEFGGSAAAQATWGDKLKVTFGNLQEAAGRLLAPAIEKAGKVLTGFINGMLEGTGAGGRFVSTLKGIGAAVSTVVGFGRNLVAFFRGAGSSSSDAAKSVRSGFGSISQTVRAVWSTLKKTAGDIATAFRGVSDDLRIIGTRMAQAWGIAWGFISAVIRRALPGIRALISGLATMIRGVVDIIAGLLTLDFARVWDGVKRIVAGAVRAVGGLIRGMTAAPREVLSKLGEWAGDVGRAAARAGANLVKGVVSRAAHLAGDLADKLKDAVVGFARWNVEIRLKAIKAGIDLVRGVVSKAKDLPGELWNAVKGAIGRLGQFERDLAAKGLEAGKGLLRGIVNGIKSAPGAIVSAITGLIPGPLRKIAKKIPGIGQYLRRGGRVGPTAGGPRLFVAGEGERDEWVISQEGDRRQNVAWAVEALRELTGRQVELHRAGKGPKRKRHAHRGAPKPVDAGALHQRSVGRGEAGIKNYERDIQRLEREYGQLDRGYGISVEEFVVERPDGTSYVDEKAVGKRVDEIDDLIKFATEKIRKKIQDYRAAVDRLIHTYNRAKGRLGRALKAATGKKRGKERQGYRDKIADYVDRTRELRDVYDNLGLDLEDNDLDIRELKHERAEVSGTKAPAAPASAPADSAPEPAAPPADTGTDGPAAAPTTDTTTPATPLQIAEGAAALFAAFNASRADLFGSFGANFMRAGSLASGPAGISEPQQAAGARFFGAGASGSEAGAVTATGGGVVQHINVTIADPGDTHVFTQSALHELQAAV